ncbi:hypothetical protein O181_107560 [Austropuccinia psidii MF-1]|uniref:Uncharacterized protein n=1 Tax=Austropuccinia psidii MF-1 TaxID=1389203 RepID=A0A9Q3PNR5_9BASI|nr:hypothetical protein [Austropuccinia psidii MF-1]
MGPEKTEDFLRDWTPMSCKGHFQQIKAWLKAQRMFSEDQKKKLTQGKDKIPVEALKASKSIKSASTSAKQGKENPKEESEGQAKGKGKRKGQVEEALHTELQNSQEREESLGQCVQYGEDSDGI